jgi:hypothetical protein
MSLPRDRDPDLSLEPLGDRDGLRRAHLGQAAQVRLLDGATSRVDRFSAAYQALVDAAFTAPGATEWLNGMWKRVAAILADRDRARHPGVASDAIRAAAPGPERS